MTQPSFEYRWTPSMRRTFLWSLFCSALVLPVYFSHRFIQAVSGSFQNRFSTWLGLCSVSAPTHKTLLLSPEAQLAWQRFGCSLVQTGETDEGDDMSIFLGYLWTKASRSLWMLWPPHYLLQALFQSLVNYCLRRQQCQHVAKQTMQSYM